MTVTLPYRMSLRFAALILTLGRAAVGDKGVIDWLELESATDGWQLPFEASACLV
jgi:hypothetical protein